MWEASDEALLAGLAAGDPEAALVLVRRHQKRVYGLALLICGDPADAEDVAQEAFLRAWRHAEAFDARRATVAAWLLVMTRNLAIDHLRARRRRPVEGIDVRALRILSDGADPSDHAVVADEVARVVRAMRALPEQQRRALVLAAFQGRTASEISEIEHIPLGTAKTRIRSALLRVRDGLGLRGTPEQRP